jgi:hypothetical protein
MNYKLQRYAEPKDTAERLTLVKRLSLGLPVRNGFPGNIGGLEVP